MNDRQHKTDELVSQQTTRTKPPTTMTARRRDKLIEMHESALELSAPEHSVLRSAAADLLEIGGKIAKAVKKNLRGENCNVHQLQRMSPALAMLVQVHRYASRHVRADQIWAAGSDSGSGRRKPRQLPFEESGES